LLNENYKISFKVLVANYKQQILQSKLQLFSSSVAFIARKFYDHFTKDSMILKVLYSPSNSKCAPQTNHGVLTCIKNAGSQVESESEH
jgi:hypothetical protein